MHSIKTESEMVWLRQIVRKWRKITKKVKRDKELFFSIRNFIVTRLMKKGFGALTNICLH